MYENLVNKMKDHFGKEGLIMYSKSCDYYKMYPITKSEIKMYFDLLISREPLPFPVPKMNHIACCLFYLSKDNEAYINNFCKQIIEKLNPRKDEINDLFLSLIYNVIEFDMKYLQSAKNKLEFLLAYLERFSSHPKTITNFILFKYYRGTLKLHLKEYDEANTENLEIIMSLADDVKKTSNYTEFIKLKNDLFKVKLIKENQKNSIDLREETVFLKVLFDRVKQENKYLAIKLGFGLYSNYYRQFKFNDCIQILTEMKHILKKELFSGTTMMNGLDFYLDIASRLGYMGILTDNQKLINSSMKKVDKMLHLIKNDLNDKKLLTLKYAYSFVLTILNINSKIYLENSKDISATFKSQFLPNLSDPPKSFIVNNGNKNDCIIDLYIINNMDIDSSDYSKNILNTCITYSINNSFGQPNMVMTFILGIHGSINMLSESYCNDSSIYKQKDYEKKIIDYSLKVLEFVKNQVHNDSLINTAFLKSTIIEIYSAYAHIFIYKKDYKNLQSAITFFDDLSRKIGINDRIPSYDLVLKIKGDYWRENNDLKGSAFFYENALKIMSNSNPKKPIIYFNLAFTYFANKNKELAIENLNRCINSYSIISKNNNLFDFYKRSNVMNQKIIFAQQLLDKITGSK